MKNQYDTSDVIEFEPLYESMLKCKNGVMWKDSVASYRLNAIEKTLNLSTALKNGTYRASPTVKFMITSPKPRDIEALLSGTVYIKEALTIMWCIRL